MSEATVLPREEQADIPQRAAVLTDRQSKGRLTKRFDPEAFNRTGQGDDAPGYVPGAPKASVTKPGNWAKVKGVLAAANPFTIPGARVPLLVFGLMGTLASLDNSVISVATPQIQATFGVSITMLVTLGTVMTFVSTLIALPMGYISDRVKSRVWLLRISAVGGSIASLLQAFAGSFTSLWQLRAAGGAVGMVQGPVHGTLLADYYPPNARGRAQSFLSITGMLGGLLAGPLVGAMVMYLGWRKALLITGTIGLVVSFATFLLKEPVRGEVDKLAAGATKEKAAEGERPISFSEGVRAAWAVRSMRRQAFAGLFISVGSIPIQVIGNLVMVERFALDPMQFAWIGSLQMIAILPAMFIGGAIADRLATLRPTQLTLIQGGLMVLSAGVTLVMCFSYSLTLTVGAMTCVAFAGGMLGPATYALHTMLIPTRLRGVGTQITAPFALVGAGFGPVLTEYATTHNPGEALLYFAPIPFLGALVFMSSASLVDSDIKAATAANLAESEALRAKAAGADKMLVVRGVEVTHGDVKICSGINLDVRDGETLALLGTNGAGKSTLMRAIAGLHAPSNGAVFINGRDTTHTPAYELAARGVVYMPGGQAVFPSMTVRENLRAASWYESAAAKRTADDAKWAARAAKAEQEQVGLDIMREAVAGPTVEQPAPVMPAEVVSAWGEGHFDERLEQVLDFFPRLRERMDVKAGTLSGGEQQMVALSQAFLMKPQLLMIDELSLGLAPVVVGQLLETLRRIKAQGTTIILVEQSVNVATTVAERAVFMDHGRIMFDGPTAELLSKPDLVKAVFMGGSGGSQAVGKRRGRAEVDGEAPVVLKAVGIGVAYGGVQALADVDLEVTAGEIVGVMGPNGAGKTTLFDALSGHAELSGGTVEIADTDVTRFAPHQRARLGLTRSFQSARLFGDLTVRETILVALERHAVKSAALAALWAPNLRKKEKQLAERADGLIDLLGLERFRDKYVRELSTGSRRAVDVACVMATDPKALLLDEPSSGLAQAEVEALGPTFARIVRETGCGLVIIEHDLPLLTSVSDRMVAMELGRVICTGTPKEVLTNEKVLAGYMSADAAALSRSGSGMTDLFDLPGK